MNTQPTHHRKLNVQNAHIMAGALDAELAIDRLVALGFTVLRVEIEGLRPVIWIQACRRCRELGGAWYRRESSSAGVEFTWQAALCGCQIRWKTKGDA